MNSLFETLNKILSLSSDIENKLRQLTISQEVPAGTVLVEAGNICQYLYFMVEGTAIAHKNDLEQGYINFIATTSHFICTPDSFLNQRHSSETIKVLTNSKIISISFQNLQALKAEHPEIVKIYDHIVQLFMQHYKTYNHILREKQADAKLNIFYQTYSEAAQILKDDQIASFLNLTRESVVKARKRLRKKEREQKM